jgi:hypothetical protein
MMMSKKSCCVYSETKFIRHGSWFQQSKLTLQEVMYLKYDIVRRVPAHIIHKELPSVPIQSRNGACLSERRC